MTIHFDTEGDKRLSQLWFYRLSDNAIIPFRGEAIPEVCSVVSASYQKMRGQWEIEVAEGIKPVHLIGDGNCTWSDFIVFWAEAADVLELDMRSCRHVVSVVDPDTARRLDQIEKFLDSHPSGCVINATFGYPTTHQVLLGYWAAPKTVEYRGHTIQIDADPVNPLTGWLNPKISHPSELIVEKTKVYHLPGIHGGLVVVELCVAEKKGGET